MHQELEKLRKKQSAEYGIAIYENRQLQWMMLNARSEDEPFSSEDRMLYFALLPLVEKIGTYGWLDGYQRYTKEIENATATFTDTLGLRDMDPVFRYFQGMNTLRETYLSR